MATGGRGGRVLYVTTLHPDPNGELPGSLNWALRQSGPSSILFKVSGVIPAAANIVHGDVTIAGQTSPGGIIVRGLICDGHYECNTCNFGVPYSEPVANDAFDLDFDPAHPSVAPVDSDEDGMPDAWELEHGLNPAVQDHLWNRVRHACRQGAGAVTSLRDEAGLMADLLKRSTHPKT